MEARAAFALTKRQKAFCRARENEVLFGGAAGGGKSFGQLADAWLYAAEYPGSRQLVLRRTFAELEMSLIRLALSLYPAGGYKYNGARHCLRFENGSLVDFGHVQAEKDVLRYQSAEYDLIRFDELTHFSLESYLFLQSRLRGANDFPKQMKCTSNPGGPGHVWVKERFVDPAPPDTAFLGEDGARRVYLPAKLSDNYYLSHADPGYKKRLERLPERERRAFLFGDWDILGGKFFPEFSRRTHVEGALSPPPHWPVVRALDYGLDALACYWIAMDEAGRAHVYRELFESGLVISEAAGRILAAEREDGPANTAERYLGPGGSKDDGRGGTTRRGAANRILQAGREGVLCTYAPPDLWNRRQETGRSAAEIFAGCGVPLTRVSNNARQGWLDLKEWLAAGDAQEGPGGDKSGGAACRGPRLVIGAGCKNLIASLEGIQCDEKDTGKPANEPHHLTHAPDALRYFVSGRPEGLRAAGTETDEDEGLRGFLDFGG